MHFQQDGRQRYHIPDFILATTDHQEFVEVKFQRDIDAQVQERTALLQQLLQPYGYGYRLVSEAEIRSGHALANSKSLLLRGRDVAPQLWALQTYEMVRQEAQPLARFGWDCPGQPEAGWVASEIMAGRLYVDLAQRLCSDSAVGLPLADHREGQLWLSAASK